MLSNCGAGEDSWESLGLQGDQIVNPKGNQPWIFIGMTDAEAPILWLPDAKSWLTGKDPDPGKDWRQEERQAAEDEMVGWHHWLNGHEFEQTPGDGEGQGSLVGCSPWGCKELDTMTKQQKQNVRLETFPKKLVACCELMRSYKNICLSRAGMRASQWLWQ